MMRQILIALLAAFSFSACSSGVIHDYFYDIQGKYEESVRNYNNLYRWNEFEAASRYAVDPLREDAIARVKAAKDVRIVDSRVMNSTYDSQKRKGTMEVEIDYYFLNTTRVKTIRNTQEWVYFDKPEMKGWRLVSPLPEFK